MPTWRHPFVDHAQGQCFFSSSSSGILPNCTIFYFCFDFSSKMQKCRWHSCGCIRCCVMVNQEGIHVWMPVFAFSMGSANRFLHFPVKPLNWLIGPCTVGSDFAMFDALCHQEFLKFHRYQICSITSHNFLCQSMQRKDFSKMSNSGTQNRYFGPARTCIFTD